MQDPPNAVGFHQNTPPADASVHFLCSSVRTESNAAANQRWPGYWAKTSTSAASTTEVAELFKAQSARANDSRAHPTIMPEVIQFFLWEYCWPIAPHASCFFLVPTCWGRGERQKKNSGCYILMASHRWTRVHLGKSFLFLNWYHLQDNFVLVWGAVGCAKKISGRTAAMVSSSCFKVNVNGKQMDVGQENNICAQEGGAGWGLSMGGRILVWTVVEVVRMFSVLQFCPCWLFAFILFLIWVNRIFVLVFSEIQSKGQNNTGMCVWMSGESVLLFRLQSEIFWKTTCSFSSFSCTILWRSGTDPLEFSVCSCEQFPDSLVLALCCSLGEMSFQPFRGHRELEQSVVRSEKC